MKKLIFTMLLLIAATAHASVLPPDGISEDYAEFTGIEAKRAVVLCESLSVCDERGGRTIATLSEGDHFMTTQSWDGWADCHARDGSVTGWVRSDYIVVDPAWYVTDESMQVYAYPDFRAPRVALLDAGTKLPILHEEPDWFVVSLRGAAGWIRKTAQDKAQNNSFQPEQLASLAQAELRTDSASILLSDPTKLDALSALLIHADPIGQQMAGCPFTAQLHLTLPNGEQLTLEMATDSCCVYRVNGWDYQYARHLVTPEENPDNQLLFSLFEP